MQSVPVADRTMFLITIGRGAIDWVKIFTYIATDQVLKHWVATDRSPLFLSNFSNGFCKHSVLEEKENTNI